MKNIFNEKNTSIRGSIGITLFVILMIVAYIIENKNNNVDQKNKIQINDNGKKYTITIEY